MQSGSSDSGITHILLTHAFISSAGQEDAESEMQALFNRCEWP
jgi:hypothetical protein